MCAYCYITVLQVVRGLSLLVCAYCRTAKGGKGGGMGGGKGGGGAGAAKGMVERDSGGGGGGGGTSKRQVGLAIERLGFRV